MTRFDDLPELAVPLAREWDECARMRRSATVRMGELLLEFRRLGLLPDLSSTTVVEFGVRHGLSAAEARQIADLGVAVERIPAIADDVRAGEVSLQAAGQLGRIAPHEPPEALAAWRETAKNVTAQELRSLVDERIEEVRAGHRPMVTLTLHVPDETRRGFARARELVSKKAGEIVTEGQTLTAVVDHYLGDFDPDRVKPGKRRMPDTRGVPGRHVPAEVRRQVRARTGGRCPFPGCVNRIWVEYAHRVAHRAGGSREANNGDGLCRNHHVRADRGEFTIAGSPEEPVFYDAKGRRILPNGRIAEDFAGGGERAPP